MSHKIRPISPQQLQQLSMMGRGGDTMLAHINEEEAELLKRHGGSGTINPKTGLPEFMINSGIYWNMSDGGFDGGDFGGGDFGDFGGGDYGGGDYGGGDYGGGDYGEFYVPSYFYLVLIFTV